MRTFPCLLPTLLLAAMCCAPPAGAAESYDSCTGYIDSLPAVIGTQGTWCLRMDLKTPMTSGSAIRINADNVTIDCNDFKIGGLAAGTASQATGIYGTMRRNVTVRNCNVRGFFYGISLSGTGHLIEDNRLDGQLIYGISAGGANNTVRRNRVLNIGGYSGNASGVGIYAAGNVTGNTVIGVSASGSTDVAYGILLRGHGSVARGNTVRALRVSGADNTFAFGIYSLLFSGVRIEHNDISDASADRAFGIGATRAPETFCGHNTIHGFKHAMTNCIDTGGNVAF